MSATATLSSWGAADSQQQLVDDLEIKMETVPCPCCQSTSFEPILTGNDHLTGLGGPFALVRCSDCRLVLTNPRPDVSSLGYFYPSNYSPYESGKSTGWWAQLLEKSALRSYYGYPNQPVGPVGRLLGQLGMWKFRSRRKRHEWFPYRSPGQLLDVGCGSGAFLKRMRDFGWNVTGLDLAAEVALRVQRQLGIQVHVGTLPHPQLKSESYDALTMWHVLEHVPDPKGLLRSAADLLRPNGLLVIEVPNIASWTFNEFGSDWFGLELPRHFQHFDADTIRAVLPAGRFRNVEVQQIGSRSWMRNSAQRAVASGRTEYQDLLTRGKAYWNSEANRTESLGQGDAIRLIAERI